MENEKIVWIKFLQMKTKKTKIKKQVEFFTFFEVYTVRVFFSIELFLGYGSIFWFCCPTFTKNLRSCLWLVYLKFPLGYGYPHLLFAYKKLDYVKTFCPCIGFISNNTCRVSWKISKKWGTLHC